MTITSTATRHDYTGNGVTVDFDFTFKAHASAHVQVLLAGVVQSVGYTVALEADQDTTPGGTVTFLAAPGAVQVRIQRVVPLTQETNLAAHGPFPAETIERTLDRAIMVGQQIERDAIDRESALAGIPTIPLPQTHGGSGAGSLGAGLISAMGTSMPRSLAERHADVINVLDFGAVGNGVADDTVAIQAAINTARAVYLPKGTYKVTGLTAVAGGALIANRDATITLAVGSTVALTIAAHNVTVRGLRFDGGNVGPYNLEGVVEGTRSGISIPSGSVYGVHIEDCFATGFDANGLYITSTAQASGGDPGLPAVNVIGFTATTNYNGIFLDALGEYVQLTNCNAGEAYAAVRVIGGNNRVVNSHFSHSWRNALLRGGNNGHHGSFIGCSFNHVAAGAAKGLDTFNVQLGMLFIGCHFWYAPLLLQDSGGLVFEGCQFGESTITATYAGTYNGGINAFVGNWLYAGVTVSLPTTQPTRWVNNVWHGIPGVTVSLSYSASITPDATHSEHQSVTVTNGTAFTINNPTNPTAGARLAIQVLNASGGALGAVTWGSEFKMAAFAAPATGFSRTVVFQRRGAFWYEVSRTPADVPN